MNRLSIPSPVSAGLLLSYKCTSRCRHCMYASSQKWDADWISDSDIKRILTRLSESIRPSPYGPGKVSVNHGLHFTGGEPFLNFDLLLRAAEIARELAIPSTFAETNCCWCTDDDTTRKTLSQLRDVGLKGILISVNPFILEHVPFERTERAMRIGMDVFEENRMVYQEFFCHQFNELGIKGTLSFEGYLQKAGPGSLQYTELLPMGRLPYKLGHLFKRYPSRYFFGESCKEELTRNWHVHIDNYGNYIPGYCGGISLGDAHHLDAICQGIDLDEYPILEALTRGLERLHTLGREFGYTESEEGCISKCHLCVDIRKHLVHKTDQFKELLPRQFYSQLTTPP